MPEAQERDERHIALRRFLRMATYAWTGFFVVDVVAAWIHAAPIEYLAALRFVGTGIGLAAYVLLRRKHVRTWVLDAVEATLFPVASLLVSLGAIPCGGIASPIAHGVGIITLVRAVLPAPWTRSLPTALSSTLMFPVTMSVASLLVPALQAQLRSPAMLSFVESSVLLALSAAVAAAGSHLQWEARRQVAEARRLGSYRLVARIGSGGMGEVWIARQLPLDRPVALKLLKKRSEDEPGALRRFKREANAASRLSHPNTIRVFDFGASNDGVFFIAMELLDGLDLEAIVNRAGPLPAERAIHLARKACGSLAEAHQRGIVHCDIKPANVFITKVGDELDFVKVLDFGLARVMSGPGMTTVVDAVRGTPAFMAPEQVRGERVGPESDVYGMGALLYFMVTGSAVFPGETYHEMVKGHLDAIPQRPSDRLGDHVPSDLEAVILKCLAKKRADRYASARDLEEALAACKTAGWTQEKATAAWARLRPSLTLAAASRV